MVLLVLNDMIGSGKTNWTVCQKEIAERAGCGRTVVSKAITGLVRAGILKAGCRGPASAVLTYEINAAKLLDLQRPARTPGRAARDANSNPTTGRPDGGSQDAQSVVRGAARPGPQDAQPGSQGEQAGPHREHETVPGTLSASAPGSSEGPLPAGAGSFGRAGGDTPPSASEVRRPLSHLELLSPYNRSVVQDVEREVPLKELRCDPARVGTELNELRDAHPGVQAADIVQVLTSRRFSGLRELSWGLLLLKPELFDRFALLLGETVAARVTAAAADDTPLAVIELNLRSQSPPERVAAVNCLGDRFERTGDPAWLLRLAAVFAGKGRDPLPRVRRHAIDRLHRLLALAQPSLPANVLSGLGAAVRRASRDDDLRAFAEFIAEDCLATRRRRAMFEVIEFRVWKKWLQDLGRCQAITARGRQCKNRSHPLGHEVCDEDDFHRVEFVTGVTDRCHPHGRPVSHAAAVSRPAAGP